MASFTPGTAMYSSRLPATPGSPGMTRCLAGAWAGGSQVPWPPPVLSWTAAATWPTLVRTCSEMARELRSVPASDWTIMPCGGTLIPVSVVSCSGPASVEMSTATSATWLPAFIRYSWIRPAVRWPGPVNQKLVPGLVQAAVGRLPALVCSASRPWASEPLAWMTTPPLTGVVASALPCCAGPSSAASRSSSWSRWSLLGPGPGPGARLARPLVWVPPACWARAVLRAVARSTATWASRGTPGWVTLSTRGPGAALPVPVSRVTFSAAPACAGPAGGRGGHHRDAAARAGAGAGGRADPLHRGDRRHPR